MTTFDDKTLLELAAKAAGMENMKWTGVSFVKKYDPSKPDHETGCIGPEWNPLTDDGDAMRLAVKLRISFYLAECLDKITECGYFDDEKQEWVYVHEVNDDPYAATRRAIVRAAAKIGKTL